MPGRGLELTDPCREVYLETPTDAPDEWVIELQQPQTWLDLLYGFQSDSGLPALEEIIDLAGRVRLEYRFTGD